MYTVYILYIYCIYTLYILYIYCIYTVGSGADPKLRLWMAPGQQQSFNCIDPVLLYLGRAG